VKRKGGHPPPTLLSSIRNAIEASRFRVTGGRDRKKAAGKRTEEEGLEFPCITPPGITRDAVSYRPGMKKKIEYVLVPYLGTFRLVLAAEQKKKEKGGRGARGEGEPILLHELLI